MGYAMQVKWRVAECLLASSINKRNRIVSLILIQPMDTNLTLNQYDAFAK